MSGVLADAVVFAHVLYVAYVVLGQLAVVAAALFRWQWGRNPWFRLTHLLAIGIVVVETVMGWECPLTTWEAKLRVLGGQSPASGETFVGRLLHDVLFVNDQPPVFFTVLYAAVFVVVLQGLLMYPPRFRRPDRPSPLAAA